MKYNIECNDRHFEVEFELTVPMTAAEFNAFVPAASTAAPVAPARESTEETALAAPQAVSANGDVVAAPMPGTILKVAAANGQKVTAGTVLVVLEAMKMENEILAPRDGVVAQVLIAKGSTVDTGAPLVVLA